MAGVNLRISDLRTRITFQEPTITKNGGAQVETYADVINTPTVWSNWVYDHGQEAVQSDAEQATLRATVTIRHRTDVLSSWRILKDNKPWNIIAPPEPVQNRNRWLVLRVEQVEGTV